MYGNIFEENGNLFCKGKLNRKMYKRLFRPYSNKWCRTKATICNIETLTYCLFPNFNVVWLVQYCLCRQKLAKLHIMVCLIKLTCIITLSDDSHITYYFATQPLLKGNSTGNHLPPYFIHLGQVVLNAKKRKTAFQRNHYDIAHIFNNPRAHYSAVRCLPLNPTHMHKKWIKSW